MSYTIIIKQTESDLAKNLLRYLKSLTDTKEYDFLQIIEKDEDALSEKQKKELDKRHNHFLEHHDNYPDWEDVKHKYVKS